MLIFLQRQFGVLGAGQDRLGVSEGPSGCEFLLSATSAARAVLIAEITLLSTSLPPRGIRVR
jgi:hypothetical protein